ncbi:MAG: hypothetical protein ACTSRU_21405 [Candidatus Hodarchaeales archaeon]
MNTINRVRYSRLYSLFRYLYMRARRRIVYPVDELGNQILLDDSVNYRIFLQIAILSSNGQPKTGSAIFKVIFHASTISSESVEKRTKYTIPFFVGLPGFCNKKFMVNHEDSKFSGIYEWESVESAQAYARSFAVKFMTKRSDPFPVYYEIIDKSTNEVVEKSIEDLEPISKQEKERF